MAKKSEKITPTPHSEESESINWKAGLTTQDDLDTIRDSGVFVYPNFDVYVGWFILDKEERTIVRQGLGTYFLYVGGYYSGRWANDQLCRGKIKYPNGAVFWGKFNELQLPQGEGMYYFPNRGWLTAKFAKGVPLANIEFLDKNYGEWLGTPELLSERIVFQQKNIFLNRASLARAKRISEMCTAEDRFRETLYKAHPVCMPLTPALQLKPSFQELFDSVFDKRTRRTTRSSSYRKGPQLSKS